MPVVAQLLRARAFALTACVSLALAVGANSAIFSIVSALWFRPLPVRDAARVVVPYRPVVHSPDGELLDDVRLPEAEALAQLSSFDGTTFELSTAVRLGDWRPIVRLKPSLRQVHATAVAWNYFEVLGVSVRGRAFALHDDQFGAAPVAVISERLRRQAGLADVPTGSVLDTTRGPVTVIGVAQEGFHGPRIGDQVDVWLPFMALGAFSDLGLDPRVRILTPVVLFARLGAGVTVGAAQAEVRTVLDQRTTLRALRNVAFPLRSEGALERQNMLISTLWFSAVLVLILGAANLAALLTARAVGQKHHWAVRLSIGATPGALVRLVIKEVLVIAAGGLALGLFVRYWLLRSIALLEPASGVPVSHLDVSLDWRVLAFALCVVVVSAAVASLGAARQAARTGLSTLLASGASTGTRATTAIRQVLLAAHVALAMTLLTTAVGLLGSVRHAMGMDLGFARDEVIFVRLRPALAQYMAERDDVQRRTRDYAEALSRLAALPDITGVSYGGHLLDAQGAGDGVTAVTVDGVPRQLPMKHLEAGAGYLRAAGVDFVEGRDLNDADARAGVTRNEMMRYLMLRRVGRMSGPPPKAGRSAAVIDSALASALWPNTPAIGRTFRLDALQITYEVVGVVRVLSADLRGSTERPTLVVPLALEAIDGMQPYDLMVRTRRAPEAVVPQVAGVLRDLFPDAPLLEVKPARQVAEALMSQERMGARIFSWYAMAAVVLGVVGMCGLLAFFIAQTRRELAIRAALGAQASRLVRIASVRIIAPVAAGVLTGLVLSGWLRVILGATVLGLNQTSVFAQAVSAAVFLLAAIAVIVAGTRSLQRVNPAEVLQQP